MATRYGVTSRVEEREVLDRMISRGKAGVRRLAHARALLQADASEGGPDWTDARIAEARRVSMHTIDRVAQRFVEDGREAALPPRPSAKAAESGLYPGPTHLLALAREFKLTEAQQAQLHEILGRMNAEEKRYVEIIECERALDRLFALSKITPDRVVAETAAIAESQGRLRSMHLAAPLETKPVLKDDRIASYLRHRGHGKHDPTQHQHRIG